MAALQATVRDAQDVRVLPGKWTWREDSQWPPLAAVLATGLWTKEYFQGLRQSLAVPVPEPTVQVGGEFATVSTSQAIPEDTDVAVVEPAGVRTPPPSLLRHPPPALGGGALPPPSLVGTPSG